MKTDLLFTEITPEDGKEYKHNSESETNSPYIVVGTYECPCPSNTFAGLLPPAQAKCQTAPGELPFKLPVLENTEPGSRADSAKKAEEEVEEEDEETYVVPEGQGCFSFRQSLLLRAKDTYAAS